MIKPVYMGISGFARSGKNTMAEKLKLAVNVLFPNLKCDILSLAKPLKDDLFNLLIKSSNINIYEMTDDEKKLVRPFMVAYGEIKRTISNGQFFTKALDEEAKKYNLDVIIIPDIRFKEYPNDELDWLKNKNGILIHVKKYDEIGGKRVYLKPPNDKEKLNDPILFKNSDFCFSLPNFKSDSLIDKEFYSKAEEVITKNIKRFFS